MQQKRILLSAYAFYPEFGGLEQQMYLLGQEYLKQGHSVTVLTEKTSPDLLVEEIIDGIQVCRMPYQAKRKLFSYLVLIFHLSAFILLNRKKYDALILRAALTLYPLIFGFWKWTGLISTPSWVTADTGGKRDEVIIVKEWPFHKLMIHFFNQHNYLNSNCDANYEHYLELGFNPKKLTRITNGIDISSYKKSRYPKKVTRFLFIARLYKEKGIREVLEAFKQLTKKYSQIQLFIAGDGPERTYIQKFIADNKLSKQIEYVGVVNNQDKDSLYARGDCLVLPSYAEGFGLVYAEAAARKKIIIATKVANLEKVFGSIIYFCEIKDVTTLKNQMEKVLETKNFIHVNYDSIIDGFNIQKTAPKILQLLLK